MGRRGKIFLAVLVVGSLLGLVAATNAWFVAVSATPPGAVTAALVRYLPEKGGRDIPSLLTYGSLISGNSVDQDKVPLVLPGDRLLSSIATDTVTEDKATLTRTTMRTSLARDFETGETEGTVIHWTLWEATVEGKPVTLTRKQRDLMDAGEPVSKWYQDGVDITAAPPTINPALYQIETTTGETVTDGTNADNLKTITRTVTVTVTYTPLKPDETPAYRHETATTDVVTRERPVITPAAQAGLWTWGEAYPPPPYTRATETVLAVPATPAEGPTRSHMLIEALAAQGTTSGELSFPLSVGNLSTVDTNVRIGVYALLTPSGKNAIPLILRGPADGTYYLGTDIKAADDKQYFLELLSLRPAEAEEYRYTPVTDRTATAPWSLWDLTLTPTKTTVIPAVADPEQPELYRAMDLFSVVLNPAKLPDEAGKPPFITDPTLFEAEFNKYYCEGSPLISVHISYYVRQSQFMEWSEFYSQSFDVALNNGP